MTHSPSRCLQVAENTALLKEFRDNIISILGRMDAMGGVMRQMPVLPVRGAACRKGPRLSA